PRRRRSRRLRTAPPGPAAGRGVEPIGAIEMSSSSMRSLAPPRPSSNTPGGASSINNGSQLFSSVGCALCHTPTLTTGDSTVAALRNKNVNLYSDLLVHNMGIGLTDNVIQG